MREYTVKQGDLEWTALLSDEDARRWGEFADVKPVKTATKTARK